MSDILEQKKQWRADCLALRLALSPEERRAADAALCRHIATHPAFLGAEMLLAFFPVRGEPALDDLFSLASARCMPIAFPYCRDQRMTFHTVSSPNALIPDRFGIPAPPADAPSARISSRTLCLLPGLAAGRDGTRLGYGGGFYDRFLATFEGKTLFPIYDCLLFPTLPVEPTDMRVTYLVTEKGEIPLHV